MRLSAVRVFVRDVRAAKRFYEDVLELKMQADASEQGYCVFDCGITLILEEIPSDAPQEDQALVGRFTGLSFATPDIHLKHRELVARGVQFARAPELQFWGGWLATLTDPSHNGVQLVQLSG